MMNINQYKISVDSFELKFNATYNHRADYILDEIFKKDVYNFKKLFETNLQKNDTVIDIGANIGIFSIYLAKKYPFIKVYAFEPYPLNFNLLHQNILLNETDNVIPIPLAITSDRRRFQMFLSEGNYGCATGLIFTAYNQIEIVSSITLPDIFKMLNIDKIKILKIDCEGSEYEILVHSGLKNTLQKIEYLTGEFHYMYGNRNPEALIDYCKQYFPENKMHIHCQ